MDNVAESSSEGKKKRTMSPVKVVRPEDYDGLAVDGKVELIRQLIPLGLMHVEQMLQEEVTRLCGERYEQGGGRAGHVRHGANPGRVRLAGQQIPIRIPRVRNEELQKETPLESYRAPRPAGGRRVAPACALWSVLPELSGGG